MRPGGGMRPFPPALDLGVSILFEPIALRDVTVRNRIWMAAMCQYSAAAEGPDTGAPTPWHATHLHSRAVGGVGAVIVEATAVSAEGRISPHDLGLWNDRQREAFAPITAQVASAGATPGIQLAHAGRKASTYPPFVPERGSVPVGAGGWPTLAPSAVPFAGLRGAGGADPGRHRRRGRRLRRRRPPGARRRLRDRRAARRARLPAAPVPLARVQPAHRRVRRRRSRTAPGCRCASSTPCARRGRSELPLLVRISATDWLPRVRAGTPTRASSCPAC